MSFETTALLVTWAALVLLALVVAGLVRQVHHLTQGPRTPDVGPSAGLPAPGLDRLAVDPARPTLVLFLDDDCPACHDVFQEVSRLDGAPPIRAVFSGDAPASVPSGDVRVLAGQRGLFTAYDVPATPFAVAVGPDGRVMTTEPVGSVRSLHALVARLGGPVPDEVGTAGEVDTAGEAGEAHLPRHSGTGVR